MSASAFRERIVVTGIGVVSPLGNDPVTFLQNLKSDFAHNGRADFRGHISEFGELSPNTKRSIRKSLKLMNRETQLGVAAAQQAICDSEIPSANYSPDRIGVVFGAGNVEIQADDFADGIQACKDLTGEFDLASWGQYGVSQVDPLWILRVLPNMPACHTAIANDFRGPNNTITQSTVATNMAFSEACNAIIDGDADAMIVGGTGTSLGQAALPNDITPSEAAAAFVLERSSDARNRDANVYAEVISTGSATNISFDHNADPVKAIHGAVGTTLQRADTAAENVQRICTDLQFTDYSLIDAELRNAEIDSTESILGNAGAGSAAADVLACILAIANAPKNSAALNVSAMKNGLASCLMIGSIAKRRAA